MESFRKLSAREQVCFANLRGRKNAKRFFVVSRSAIRAHACPDGQAAYTAHDDAVNLFLTR